MNLTNTFHDVPENHLEPSSIDYIRMLKNNFNDFNTCSNILNLIKKQTKKMKKKLLQYKKQIDSNLLVDRII
jgi:hypothetical protein